MEKTLKSNDDKELMRMAMLKHEQTFREQVNELHRLYRIQKMLMDSVGVNQQQQKPKLDRYNLVVDQSSQKPYTIDHYQQQLLQQAQRDISNATNINAKSLPKSNNIMMGLNIMRPDNQVLAGVGPRLSSDAQEHIAESNINNKTTLLDETEIELTLSLGPAAHNPRRRKTGKSESGQSISSSSTGSSQTKKLSPKNFNSISTTTTATTWGSFPQGSGLETGFSNGQQNSNPPWLYQALSLKLT